MLCGNLAVLLTVLPIAITALRYDPDQVRYNLNDNETATDPLHYWGEWDNHTFHSSPKNWRFPFYTVTLDRYVDGDPTNNEANDTVFEHHWMTNQFRFGGDARGLMNNLDYIQGMGMKGLYMTGSPFINMPWSGDGYGPLDFTLLDRHHGDIEDWQALVTEIHRRDMYVILDNTMATMGNLIGFQGWVNATTLIPFNWHEYDYMWKSERRYHDFHPGNIDNFSCEYPRMWDQDGFPLTKDITDQMDGCKESEFDLYGDIKSTGAYPTYINQLSKFASVQDRLREWRLDVLEKIKVMSCMQIAMFDIDGFRMDKGVQTTIDAQAEFADYQRQCARKHGKENFLIVGEIVSDPRLAGIYVGRGKQPDQAFENLTEAVMATNETDSSPYIRPFGMSALDGAAFHYDIYGAMTRFLGLDGPWGKRGVDWVEQWEMLLANNDMVNANTGEFDPRQMFGMTNQDVFRWPALANGTQRQLLGFFVTMLEIPGVPIVFYGEEQESYVLENLANDYVFGRTPMASSRAWQLHGCYKLGETQYVDMPFNSSSYGCYDDSVSLDHRDPSHPLRNVLKRMYELRPQFPTLNDGYNLTSLSSRTHNIYLPGSDGFPSPHGIWSVYRGRTEGVQDFTGAGQENQGVWFIYQNENKTVDYTFDCQSQNKTLALISAFPANTTVKNLFYPYEEYDLEASAIRYGIEKSTQHNGCLSNLTMVPWEYKAFVPKDKWVAPAPTITRVIPGHDARLQSTVAFGEQESVPIQIRFPREMDCDSVANSLEIHSTTQDGRVAQLNRSSIICQTTDADPPRYVGEIATIWIFHAQLEDVSNGVHTYTVKNATTEVGESYTNAVDRFMFRIGQSDNPMVFPLSANYTENLLYKDPASGDTYISPRAAGADKFRYSTNWGSTYSKWFDYTGANTTVETQAWSGTEAQKWSGKHVILMYWSDMTGSSDHVQHTDLDRGGLPSRRWPHVFVQGPFNQYGYDGGLPNNMALDADGLWKFDLIAEWPTDLLINVWGMNPDGYPDKSAAYGDVDGDNVLDWVPPDSLARNVINVSSKPSMPHLGYKIVVNDGNYHYYLIPVGSAWTQLILSIILGLIPIISAAFGFWAFKRSFYQVKHNEIGVSDKRGLFDFARGSKRTTFATLRNVVTGMFIHPQVSSRAPGALADALHVDAGAPDRRTVLIATMEYNIEDWNIGVKIGGLGVMASLMGKNLGHQDLIWVVPCVGDIDYPRDQPGEPMDVVILGNTYEIEVQYHILRNITFILLDAPIFRKQTKTEPYPPRMDDLDSAIYYSAWNQCIAFALERFPVDIYHINDYHGTVAPLHLLPRTIPVCLSLHNAEFQGLWSLRKPEDKAEISKVYNLPEGIVEKYVQFGEVFNLLHAGASYLRIHQKGFGAVGVSKKYGKRSWARYPIFWGLAEVGALANPDPSDTGDWNKELPNPDDITIQSEVEMERGNHRRQVQEWAGLEVNPDAELFVFVGRWSQQKGIDLIADVFFSILEENPKTQLICVGPVIDLYGKFAALKLEKMMEKYPGRVCSKPEFTALPPYIFSGTEFVLIPSRDEPFGLVAVEFGRKGALGVGARVGGLGQMPGWWYMIESIATKHLIHQFKMAIRGALTSKKEVRALMRARSALQRFPVAQWVEDLEKLYSTSINVHHRQAARTSGMFGISRSGASTPFGWSAALAAHDTLLHNSSEQPNEPYDPARSKSLLSLYSVRGEGAKKDFNLQKVDPFFTDFTGLYYKTFQKMLNTVDAKSSEDQLCIEDYLTKSEKQWFGRFHLAKLGKSPSVSATPTSSVFNMRWSNRNPLSLDNWTSSADDGFSRRESSLEQFLLDDDYISPKGLRKLLQRKIGDWQIYSFLLAFGQIIAVNSYQITLLTGENGEPANKLYVLASIYIAASVCWWLMFRRAKSIYVLALPFMFYGLAFFLVGMGPYVNSYGGRRWLNDVATAMYAIGSASGSLFFALNFGIEGGAPVQSWVYRACVIQGTQQIYIAGLWYWGSELTALSINGVATKTLVTSTPVITAITTPIAVLLWTVGLILFIGLPNYYRQAPGRVPSFYGSLLRRKIVLWFFVMVIIQNYWLSAPYGRNWRYLWSSQHAPAWAIVLLLIVFFIGVWAAVLWVLHNLSKQHSWILPIFAIGLGAPRWCQMLWGVSNIGVYVPWGGRVIGALLGRSLWLWLGVLDAAQGVGFGMILLQTLTRFHIVFTLIAAQVIGSVATIAARASAPNATGPGDVFPDFSLHVWDGLQKAWFWVVLVFQLTICVGFFLFFRKEQLFKP